MRPWEDKMSGIKDALSCQLGGGDISIMLISSDTPGINATHTSCYSSWLFSRKRKKEFLRISWEQHLIRPDICHEYHEIYSWKRSCHVEKFQLSMYYNCGEIENFSTCGEISGQLIGFYCNLCRFVAKSVIHAVLLQNLFCQNLCAFIFLEKNDKYEVWYWAALGCSGL